MKIAYISAVFPPEPAPHAVMAAELAIHLAGLGHQFSVYCPFPNRPQGKIFRGYRRRFRSVSVQDGYRVVRGFSVFVGPRRGTFWRLLEWVSHPVFAIPNLLLDGAPDVILLAGWPILGCIPVVILSKLLRIPVVNYIKDLYPESAEKAGIIAASGRLYRLALAVDSWVCRNASVNVVIGPGHKRSMVTRRGVPPDRVEVVSDWLDPEKIKPLTGRHNTWRSDVRLPAEALLALFAGTLGFASGVTVLVEVAKILLSRRKNNIHLVCVGEGIAKQNMQSIIQSNGLSNLTLLPFQPRDRMSEYLSACDVALVTMNPGAGQGSIPSKLVTYMAAGLPTICAADRDSDTASLIEQAGSGWVVPPADAEAIASALISAYENRERLAELGRVGRQFFVENFAKDESLKRMTRILELFGGAPQE